VEAADPVRARRARVARWTRLANRAGYVLLAVAVVLFFVALATGFSGTFALLAPSIVLGYAVKAAEREDRERGL
jgi:NhaP-type Na+/H+ or K+/H+ antiporter